MAACWTQVAAQQRLARARVDHGAVRVGRVDLDGRVPDDGRWRAARTPSAARSPLANEVVERASRRTPGERWAAPRRRRCSSAATRACAAGQPGRDAHRGEAGHRRAGDVDEPAVGRQVRAQAAVRGPARRRTRCCQNRRCEAVAGADAPDEHEVRRGPPRVRPKAARFARTKPSAIPGRGRPSRAGQEAVQAAHLAEGAVPLVDGDDRASAPSRARRPRRRRRHGPAGRDGRCGRRSSRPPGRSGSGW